MATNHQCSDCGGTCNAVIDNSSLHLHVEIENLRQRLLEKENHIVEMETNFLSEIDKHPHGEYASMAEELSSWQDKYSRLYDAHKRIQKVNQSLEDKLLKIVDKCETEKSAMFQEVQEVKRRLLEANATISSLKQENEEYEKDVYTAIQLLQCQPSNFVPQKLEFLSSDLQEKVNLYISNKKKNEASGNLIERSEPKTIPVPISTFPPTAMFYSVNESTNDDKKSQETEKEADFVSAAVVAKILDETSKSRLKARHCRNCFCPFRRKLCDASIQTYNLSENSTSNIQDSSSAPILGDGQPNLHSTTKKEKLSGFNV